jgi:hypothetical protein
MMIIARMLDMARYPEHWFSSDELLSFIESKVFQRSWKKCGLTDNDLFELQVRIMMDPFSGVVIEGTGGLRKLRFSPDSHPVGKAGPIGFVMSISRSSGSFFLLLPMPRTGRIAYPEMPKEKSRNRSNTNIDCSLGNRSNDKQKETE